MSIIFNNWYTWSTNTHRRIFGDATLSGLSESTTPTLASYIITCNPIEHIEGHVYPPDPKPEDNHVFHVFKWQNNEKSVSTVINGLSYDDGVITFIPSKPFNSTKADYIELTVNLQPDGTYGLNEASTRPYDLYWPADSEDADQWTKLRFYPKRVYYECIRQALLERVLAIYHPTDKYIELTEMDFTYYEGDTYSYGEEFWRWPVPQGCIGLWRGNREYVDENDAVQNRFDPKATLKQMSLKIDVLANKYYINHTDIRSPDNASIYDWDSWRPFWWDDIYKEINEKEDFRSGTVGDLFPTPVWNRNETKWVCKIKEAVDFLRHVYVNVSEQQNRPDEWYHTEWDAFPALTREQKGVNVEFWHTPEGDPDSNWYYYRIIWSTPDMKDNVDEHYHDDDRQEVIWNRPLNKFNTQSKWAPFYLLREPLHWHERGRDNKEILTPGIYQINYPGYGAFRTLDRAIIHGAGFAISNTWTPTSIPPSYDPMHPSDAFSSYYYHILRIVCKIWYLRTWMEPVVQPFFKCDADCYTAIASTQQKGDLDVPAGVDYGLPEADAVQKIKSFSYSDLNNRNLLFDSSESDTPPQIPTSISDLDLTKDEITSPDDETTPYKEKRWYQHYTHIGMIYKFDVPGGFTFIEN